MVKTILGALGRVRAALRRAVIIKAARRTQSQSLEREGRLYEFRDSPQCEGGRRFLVSEQWDDIERQAAEIAEKRAQG